MSIPNSAEWLWTILRSKALPRRLSVWWGAASDTDTKNRNRLGAERLDALQFLNNVYGQLRVKKMTAEEKSEWQEERLRQINMMDWCEDVAHSRDIKSIDIEPDFA